ncbi:hypothetical protein KDD17_09085 [Sulfitobacter albidus]|uniref:Uncharacterized protein n=1 Tax=Sulfitobacter albidus TaxID=2829501 RepID=A0A975JBQ4_9RHOB|nr:hypothetical protein [Sulfitobacter albidus]QUJ75180.1 hypothetical protein KDD17_09085 [Sulfitobacter albidus]
MGAPFGRELCIAFISGSGRHVVPDVALSALRVNIIITKYTKYRVTGSPFPKGAAHRADAKITAKFDARNVNSLHAGIYRDRR